MAHWTEYSTPDAELAPLLAKLPPSILGLDDPVATREKLKHMLPAMQKATQHELPPDADYRVEDRKIPVEGGEITIRCLVPTSESGKTFPVLVWFHGGGWSMGSIDMDDYSLRRICVTLQIVIVNVDYRLVPEHPFPTSLDDCYAGLKWTAENASLISGAVDKGFLVGGFSAGASAATIVAHRARDDAFFQGCPLTGQALQVPQVVHPDACPEQYKPLFRSIEQNKDAPILNREGLLKSNAFVGARPDDPNLFILLAPSHANLPPTFIQVAGADPLRDDGLVYEQVLRESGVQTKFEVYPGMPHGGRAMFPNTAIYKKWDKDQLEGLRWLLR
ncbi:unnamed protein product [Somion occarium]|uniref:Alpha/beta hydrolase fold-3 domain-containing protein n=1 Tax=Somion occarium TaxID=3059160 RepID=A0ABP1DHW5_9APHY